MHKDTHDPFKGAVGRLEAGTYGSCETCGEKLEPAQLRVDPYAVACRRCAPER
jgi:RNA polymerase-binding transcription factor DksA